MNKHFNHYAIKSFKCCKTTNINKKINQVKTKLLITLTNHLTNTVDFRLSSHFEQNQKVRTQEIMIIFLQNGKFQYVMNKHKIR